MYFAAILATVLVALPVAVKSQVLTFYAYPQTSMFRHLFIMGGEQEEWQGAGPGRHVGNFEAPRYSFSICQTDHRCYLEIYEGLNQGGGSVQLWGDQPGDGTCSWTSPDYGYWSLSINCN
ncbi:hypothetical protein DACRYDRAFT_108756 [Dacryopinax primogenitus]|uniref:Uncharacterized protein n=1 Tax=Dacryopinax primogenitus (strain DJM 731) TaxID=1858805 RepID=M5FWF3_DACPD|nr:uncharacterized protein DACRYDRAFT_108756 [Dacryopinax primogenitus]EJU00689.1 hypothetical protein DACRYDRAFT_108756 [Dacryopinax primogenitus]